MLNKLNMYISKVLLLIVLVVGQPMHASADFTSWIENTFEDLFDFLFSSCLEIPRFKSFATGNAVMSLNQATSGQWINVANSVNAGKMLKIQWNTRGIQTQPRKYMVLYRIDPRFSRPQLFIVQYNYDTQQYDSDFHQFNNGKLNQYQMQPSKDFATRGSVYDSYFNFGVGRSPITVDPGDVVSITLVPMSTLLEVPGSQFTKELDTGSTNIASVFTSTGLQDNSIFYSDSATWCNYVSANPSQFKNITCTTNPSTGADVFGGPQTSYNRFVGIMDAVTTSNILSLSSCPHGAAGLANNPPCIYDHGRGMKIFAGGSEVKSTYTPFITSNFTGNDFFYYNSTGSGYLDFMTDIPIANMFSNFTPDMANWASNNYGTSLATMQSYLLSDTGYTSGMSNFLHLGRYIMMIDIGNSSAANFTQQSDITLQYQVLPAGSHAPGVGSPGLPVTSQEFSTNAPKGGNLWLMVTNPNSEVSGNITVSYAFYTGSTFLSELLYNSVALPVMDMMQNTAAMFYSGIATNPQWQVTVRTLLTLYITIYGLSFLAGKIQVTVMDVMTRVIKLAVVFAMFSASSWQFFNENVFQLFLQGMSYLAFSVMGATSSVGNLFGFVDVIFDKYTNPIVWQILCVELLQIQNGMCYVALLMIDAIFSYLSAVVEVVICYVMAFLTMCVLISLAPIFLVCMLFERTKGMFDNWMSLLFNYMIQPTILLIFFLLIDELMTNQFSAAVMNACWGFLITIDIDLDLRPIGLDFRVQFDLPFLPGIPFYTAALVVMEVACPFVSSGGELTTVLGAVLMFKIYAQLANGLIDYVTNLVASLTNVAPARKAGVMQGSATPAKAIADQLKAPVRAVTGKVESLAKSAAGQMFQAWKNPKRSGGAKDASGVGGAGGAGGSSGAGGPSGAGGLSGAGGPSGPSGPTME